MTAEQSLENLFFQALQAYQQSGSAEGQHWHTLLRSREHGGLYDHILTGWACAQEGRFKAAIAEYNRALRFGTDSQQLVFALKSDALMRLKRGGEALKTLNEGLALAPANFALHEAKFVFLLELQRLNEVIAAYDAALEQRASAVEIPLFKSLALFCLGQGEVAWAIQRQFLSQLPDPSRLPSFHGNMRVHLEQYEQLVGNVLLQDKERADGWYYRGLITLAKDGDAGQVSEAMSAFEKALSLERTLAWAWNGKGIALIAQNDYQGAIAAFAQAVALLPDIMVFAQNRKKAARALEVAISLPPFPSKRKMKKNSRTPPRKSRDSHPEKYQGIPSQKRMEQLLEEDRLDEALAACDQLLSAARKGRGGISLEATLWFRGRILLDLERTDEAIESYHELLLLNPTRATVRAELLDILMLTRRFAEALEYLPVSMESDEASEALLKSRASLLLVLDQYQEARESARALRTRNSREPLAWLIEIEALSHLEQQTEALRLCEEAVRAIPLDDRLCSLLTLHQAELLLALLRPEEALPAFELAARQEKESRNSQYDAMNPLLEGLFFQSDRGPGDLLARIYGGMGTAWLLLQNGKKAMECYDLALSLEADPLIEQNRVQAQMLINRKTHQTANTPLAEEPAHQTEQDAPQTGLRSWLSAAAAKWRRRWRAE